MLGLTKLHPIGRSESYRMQISNSNLKISSASIYMVQRLAVTNIVSFILQVLSDSEDFKVGADWVTAYLDVI